MSVNFYLSHKVAIRVLSILMVALMLIACASSPAHAVGEVVGLSLIAAILSAFGVTAVATGTVDGMLDGLEGLMGDFGESIGETRDYLRNLFNAKLSIVGYGVVKLGSELVGAVKSFISWLKSDKDLAPDSPVTGGASYQTLTIDGKTVPFVSGGSIYISDSNMSYNIHASDAPTFTSSNLPPLVSIYDRLFGVSYNNRGEFVNSPGGLRSSGEFVKYACFIWNNRLYLGSFTSSTGDFPDYFSLRNYSSGYVSLPSSYDFSINPAGGFVLNDDNLDLDFLDDDGSTKDAYFSPSIPAGVFDDANPLPSLGDLDGLNTLTRDILDSTLANTDEGSTTGTLSITSDIQPGLPSEDLPPIVIPSGGFFSSIWHYVVTALQDSAAGIAFIMNVIRTSIPPEILNLAWAACVLLIVFGIINKFLK